MDVKSKIAKKYTNAIDVAIKTVVVRRDMPVVVRRVR